MSERISPLLLGVLISMMSSMGPAVASAEPQLVGAAETGFSLAQPSLVVGVEGGVRFDRWTFLLEVDWNPFITLGGPTLFVGGVLNIGVGVEHLYAGGLLRSAFFVGTSTLLYDTALDSPGTTGLFIDLVPLSVRLPIVANHLTLRVDPVSVHLIAPVLSGIPLIRYEYRHVISLELTP